MARKFDKSIWWRSLQVAFQIGKILNDKMTAPDKFSGTYSLCHLWNRAMCGAFMYIRISGCHLWVKHYHVKGKKMWPICSSSQKLRQRTLVIIGQMLRRISATCCLFLQRNGITDFEIAEVKQHSAKLVQGRWIWGPLQAQVYWQSKVTQAI